jgi:hypothetical protein
MALAIQATLNSAAILISSILHFFSPVQLESILTGKVLTRMEHGK